jgi:serine/threonine protein kinase
MQTSGIERRPGEIKMGSNIFIYENEKLGEGSYGSVYKCSDENGKVYAVKCIPMKPEGISNIVELMIMETIRHPNLNTALHIYADKTKTYVFQKLAQSDLCKRTRKQNQKEAVSPDLLRYWCYSLVQAVACLHQQNIIHGDIKANNIFLFDKNQVKLGDFSLSIQVPKSKKSSNKGECQSLSSDDQYKTLTLPSFHHRVCTYSHRPPECWFRKGWNFPLDIWALGCTFFEMAYGRLLFPSQGKIQDKASKNLVYKRAVNCLLDWIQRGPKSAPPPRWIKAFRMHLNVDYRKASLPSRFHHPEYLAFNTLLLKMLRIDPLKRPTIQDILKDPYFEGLYAIPYKIQSVPSKSCSRKEKQRIVRYLEQFDIQEPAKQRSIQLYEKCSECKDLSEKYKIVACVWLVHKLLRLKLPQQVTQHIDLSYILESEKVLCHHLNFRLHLV